VPLSLGNRRVGDITIVKCSGRIVEGAESDALQRHLNDLLPDDPDIVLDLGDVHFIDSSGLGLLVRFLTRTQTARGDLKLCAVPANIGEILRVTRLGTIFDAHQSAAEAVSSFYQRGKSVRAASRLNAEILCVEASTDVLAYVRELLKQAGYGVITTDNLPDALTLLGATRPKLVIIGAELRAAITGHAADTFDRLAHALSVIELSADFSRHDAGDAGQALLEQIRAVMKGGNAPVGGT
jgi:anti-sigma B factor antagonist